MDQGKSGRDLASIAKGLDAAFDDRFGDVLKALGYD
jgi:hypothetical protein